MRQLFLFLIIILFSEGLNAQFKKGMSIETSFHVGQIIKHTPELLFESPGLSTGIDINLTWKTYGRKNWHQFQKYPKIGAGLMVFRLGERDTMGNAYGIHYNFTIPLFRKKRFKVDFQFASGFAMLDRPFNRITNPNNNAIGSRLNVIAHMKFMSAYRINPNLRLNYGLSFTHFSNGAAQLPNFGVNIGSALMGLVYTPRALSEEDYTQQDISKKAPRKLGLRLEYSLGFRESQAIGGPKYPIRVYSIAGIYNLNRVNRLFFGADYEFNQALYAFGNSVFAFNSEREARLGATRVTFFLADEFVFGNFGLTLQAGAYLGNFSYQLPQPIYLKLIGRYYLRVLRRPNVRIFTGIVLKSHFSIAEYFAMNVGIEF